MNPNHPPGLPDAQGWPIHPAMLSTTEQIPGFQIRQGLALVHGWQVVPVAGFGGASSVAGIEQARTQALNSMLMDAARYGANAIIGIKYTMCEGPMNFKVMVSGTCVIAQR